MEKIKRIIDQRSKAKFIIDDEYLNGYARLCGIYATGVYVSLCRHSNKNQYCFPGISLMAKELDVSINSIKKGIKNLKDWGIITVNQEKKENGSFRNNVYILLDKSVWKPKPYRSSDKATGDDREPVVTESELSSDGCRVSDKANKETNEEGNTFKETHIGNEGATGREVNQIMGIFQEINPTLNWANKTIRNSAADLIKQFGLAETKNMAEAAVSIQGQPYAPTVTTPWELKEKLAKVKAFFDRQKNDQIAKKSRLVIIS